MQESTVTWTLLVKVEGAEGGGKSNSGAKMAEKKSAGSEGGSKKTAGGDKSDASDMGWLGEAYSSYKKIKGFAPVASAIVVSKQLFQWGMNVVFRNRGNSVAQQKFNTAMSFVSKGVAIGGSLAAGIATLNPLLIAGGVTSAITTAIGLAEEREQYNYERNWESMSLRYARERAGVSYNRSRTEGN